MNEKVEVQAAISFVPYRLTHTSEGDAFLHIVRFYDGDLKRVHNAIEDTTRRLDDFYNSGCSPHGCDKKK